MNPQAGILLETPRLARLITADFNPGADARAALKRLQHYGFPPDAVIGIGDPLLNAAGIRVEGLRSFPELRHQRVVYPATQGAIWASFPGDDPGETLLLARDFFQFLGSDFAIQDDVLGFKHGSGRDLTGFEDGTENPKGEAAFKTAILSSSDPRLNGSSFVAIQRWVHDLKKIENLSAHEKSQIIGRDLSTNEELQQAPFTAHVKRTAQESFEPPAFILRRSMPWGGVRAHGLYFIAYGASLGPFERILRRMAGLEDGIPDAIAHFTTPVTGGYYWCPSRAAPIMNNDKSALNLAPLLSGC